MPSVKNISAVPVVIQRPWSLTGNKKAIATFVPLAIPPGAIFTFPSTTQPQIVANAFALAVAGLTSTPDPGGS